MVEYKNKGKREQNWNEVGLLPNRQGKLGNAGRHAAIS